MSRQSDSRDNSSEQVFLYPVVHTMPIPFKTSIQVRFGDTDMLGHVNNAAFVQYLEHARLEWIRAQHARGLGPIHIVLVNIRVDYRHEIVLGQEVEVELWPTRVGRSSFDFEYWVLADGQVCAEAHSVQVCVHKGTLSPQAVDEALRSVLEVEIGEQLTGNR